MRVIALERKVDLIEHGVVAFSWEAPEKIGFDTPARKTGEKIDSEKSWR